MSDPSDITGAACAAISGDDGGSNGTNAFPQDESKIHVAPDSPSLLSSLLHSASHLAGVEERCWIEQQELVYQEPPRAEHGN